MLDRVKAIRLYRYNGTIKSWKKMIRRLYPGARYFDVSCWIDKHGDVTNKFTGIVYLSGKQLYLKKGDHYQVEMT